MTALARRCAQSAPCRASVGADLSRSTALFEHLEGGADASLELRRLDRIELLLGIVEIVEVDRLDSEIRTTARELIGQKVRREAMSARNDILGAHDSRL